MTICRALASPLNDATLIKSFDFLRTHLPNNHLVLSLSKTSAVNRAHLEVLASFISKELAEDWRLQPATLLTGLYDGYSIDGLAVETR